MTGKIRLTRAHAYAYEQPSTEAATSSHENLLVKLEGAFGSSTAVGMGEATPRGPRTTGDDKDEAWEFLLTACQSLEGSSIPLSSREASLDGVRDHMEELRKLTTRMVPATNREKRYRATLAGIETALLDLIARAHGVSLAALWGEKRSQIAVSAATIRPSGSRDNLSQKLRRQADRFPVSRIIGKADVKADIELLRFVAETNRAAAANKAIWLMAAERYEPDGAADLIDQVAAMMKTGDLPNHIILEQPISHNRRGKLAELQKHAAKATHRSLARKAPDLQLSIMASQSVWDEDDLEVLHAAGGCAAINIGIQRTGGLLASLDLAHAALRLDPGMQISIGSTRGASNFTAAATLALAMVMPRLDYYTVTPLSNAVSGLGTPGPRYRNKATNILHRQEGHGLGLELSRSVLEPIVTRATRVPSPAQPAPSTPATSTFEFPHFEKFNKIRRDSTLLEHQALIHGLETFRVSPLIFTAKAPGSTEKVAFYRTSSDHTSLVTAVTTTHKQITRNLLQRAGVAVPDGRRFTLDQREQALAYGRKLGWPLVVKPQAGTGGAGVTANIRSDEHLAWAVDSLDGTKDKTFVVERHIEGDDYRFIVLEDRVISVLKGGPANVIGDGVSTVAELIEAKNAIRRTKQRLQGRPVSLNDRTRFQLSRQGLTWDSVPQAGVKVTLSTSGNLALGGDSIQVLDETHPSLLDMAVRAVRALPGLRYSGIDFLISDHRLPLDEQSAGICEMNSSPANAANHFPLFGPSRDVSGELFKAHCAHAHIPLRPPSNALDLHLEIRGKVQGVGYRPWMSRLAHEFGLTGWVRNAREPDLVEARLAGEAGRAAALAALAITGPRGSKPASVRTQHATDAPVSGEFVVQA